MSLTTTSLCFHFEHVGYPQRSRARTNCLQSQLEGHTGAEVSTCSAHGLCPSCARLSEPPGTWTVVRDITFEFFPPYLPPPLFLPPNTLGNSQSTSCPCGTFQGCSVEVPPSTVALLRILTKSPWSRMVGELAPPGLPLPRLWPQQSGGPSPALLWTVTSMTCSSTTPVGFPSLASMGAKSRACFLIG